MLWGAIITGLQSDVTSDEQSHVADPASPLSPVLWQQYRPVCRWVVCWWSAADSQYFVQIIIIPFELDKIFKRAVWKQWLLQNDKLRSVLFLYFTFVLTKTLGDYFSAKTLVLNWSFRPKLKPDLKSGFKPKLRFTSVLAKSFRPFAKTLVSDEDDAKIRDWACLLLWQHN